MSERFDRGRTGCREPSPRYGFEGRTALITDGAHGIGLRLALSLAARGAIPVISYESDEPAAYSAVTTIEEQGVATTAIRADLESAADIASMFDTVEERFGRLDFFVSNVTECLSRPLMELKPDDLQRSFNINVRALVLGAQRAVRLMDRGGRILAVSSYDSRFASRTGANLAPVQADTEDWARRMAVELAPLGINVNVLVPGVVEPDPTSEIGDDGMITPYPVVIESIPKQRVGFLEEVIDCALFLLSPASEYVTGTSLLVDGGLTAAMAQFQAGAGDV